jgi:hypothetical protein
MEAGNFISTNTANPIEEIGNGPDQLDAHILVERKINDLRKGGIPKNQQKQINHQPD